MILTRDESVDGVDGLYYMTLPLARIDGASEFDLQFLSHRSRKAEKSTYLLPVRSTIIDCGMSKNETVDARNDVIKVSVLCNKIPLRKEQSQR